MTPAPLRLGIAFVGGCIVAMLLALLGAGLANFWHRKHADDAVLAHPVELLYNYSRADLAELLGEPRYALPDEADVPLSLPPARAAREIRGFVMLEVEVDTQGRATSARVVSGAPEGVYETQAVREALALTYAAGDPGTRQQVIRFRLPATDPLLQKTP